MSLLWIERACGISNSDKEFLSLIRVLGLDKHAVLASNWIHLYYAHEVPGDVLKSGAVVMTQAWSNLIDN